MLIYKVKYRIHNKGKAGKLKRISKIPRTAS
jgi:hypothetical protein